MEVGMKKLFNHTKRPQEQWENYEEEDFDWDRGDGEDYSDEGEFYGDGGGDVQDGNYADGGEYAEDGSSADDGGNAEDSVSGDGIEYAEDSSSGDGIEYAEDSISDDGGYTGDGNYAEDGEYIGDGADDSFYSEDEENFYEGEILYDGGSETEDGEIRYEDGEIYNANSWGDDRNGKKKKRSQKMGLEQKLKEIPVIDRIIAATGAAVLILALITGIFLINSRSTAHQVSDFASVGTQLDGVSVIGGQGLNAVAEALQAKLAADEAQEDQPEPDEQEPEKNYEEIDYSRQVSVELNMTSIQKDLKIKFTNQKTGKLVANVPFSVTVKDPDGKSSIWSDDDMDGIIYKKDITPGTYKITIEKLTDEKYAAYTLAKDTRSVEVKKDIAYQKVDVSNEVKSESEVDAKKEDTAKNDTVVESTLQDTVAWVESTATGLSFTEIAKSTIPDPLTILTAARGIDKQFIRMAVQNNGVTLNADQGTEIPIGGTVKVTAGEPFITGTEGENVTVGSPRDVVWSSGNTQIATVDANGQVTGVAAGDVQIQYSAKVSVTVEKQDTTVTSGDTITEQTEETILGRITIRVLGEQLDKGTLTADKTAVTVLIKNNVVVQTAAQGFKAGKTLEYSAASDKENVAVATVDATGKVTITGVGAGTAKITVKANYASQSVPGTTVTEATAAVLTINVTVGGNKVIGLDRTTTLAYVANPIELKATITGATTTSPAITAEVSDTTVAKVTLGALKAENNVITVPVVLEPLKEGSVTVTVKCLENAEEVLAACVVTVKPNPKTDVTTALKDSKGNLLYVMENDKYRQATYADYYTFSKFYIKGDVKYTGWQTIEGRVFYYTAEGNAVTGEQVIQGAKYTFASDGSLVTGNGTLGIDVSKWNGTIDWTAVKNSGISYVIIRCGYRGSSQGTLIADPKFTTNIKGATAAGLKVGVYFFTQAVDEREAVEEASMVLEQIKNYKISYPVFLDVEPSGGRADSISSEMRTAVCKAFCQTIQGAGYTAGIYANKTWLETKLDPGALSAYKIWLAQYASAPTYTGRYDLWQYRATGKVSGISGDVDMNLSYLGY